MHLFPGVGGEMAERIRGMDWPATSLGPIETWSAALRNTIGLMLPAQAQIVLFWGPEYVALYNDAYAPTIGEKHPRALGRPARENWAELWSDLEPLLQGVRETGQTFFAKDRPFYIERSGGIGETVYFDVSYSLVREVDGSPAGIFCIVSETTERVRAQHRMRTDHDRFAEMFRQAPSFMAQLDGPDHVYTFANDAYQALIGRREIVGKTIREALPDIADQGFYELLDDVYRSGQPFVGRGAPLTIERENGPEQVFLDFVYQPIKAADGSIIGIFVEGFDVTEQRAAEQSLRRSEERVRHATENAGIGLWDIDADGGIDFSYSTANSPFVMAQNVRVPIEYLLGQLHPGDAPLVRASYDAARDPEQRAMMDVEYRVLPELRNPLRWIKVRGRGVFDADGNCIRVSGTAVDITKERETREALTRSEELLRLATANAGIGIWDMDLLQNSNYAQSSVKAMFGIPAEENATPQDFFSLVHKDDIDRVNAAFADAFDPEKRSTYDVEYRVLARDGVQRWLLARGQGIFDENGTCLRVIGTAMDVTARKEIEQQIRELNETLESRVVERTAALEKSQAALQQAQKMEAIGNLTGGIAHDFNNLLQGLTGSLDLIRRRTSDANVRRWAEAGLQAAERGSKLTAQLLAFSRAQKLEVRPVDLPALLNGMRDMLARTLGPSVHITLDLSKDIPPVMGDETQLEMAVLNLAINARDAMNGTGSLTICAQPRNVADDSDIEAGDYVSLAVIDTGCGMSPDIVSRAFDPFFTTKEVGKGTGLGLSQVYGMARQAGGIVRIDSKPGEGTTVRIFLRTTQGEPERPSTLSYRDIENNAPAKILIVDDDEGVLRFLSDALDTFGYGVIAANNGSAGLDILERMRPDLLIVDFAMPVMTGAQLAGQARLKHPDLPIIFASGYAETAELESALDRNATFLRKPFRLDELQSIIVRALRHG